MYQNYQPKCTEIIVAGKKSETTKRKDISRGSKSEKKTFNC